MRWRRRREDIGELRTEVERQRVMLTALLDICREAGVSVESADADRVDGVPPGLIIASRTTVRGGTSVRLTAPDGRQAIAVVGGVGDPRRWMAEINRLAFA